MKPEADEASPAHSSPAHEGSTRSAWFGNAWLLLCLAPLLWGGNAVAGKFASEIWPPFTLTAARFSVTCVVLLPFVWRPLQRDWMLIRRHALLLFCLGAFGMCLFTLMMYLALNYTSAINVSIEQAMMPMLIMLANFIVFSQSVRSLQIVGLVLSVLGVVVTATGGDPLAIVDSGLNRGDAIMLLGCVFYAGYTFGLRWRPPIHWLSFLFVVSLSAFVMTLPWLAWELGQGARLPVEPQAWLILAYVVLGPTLVSQIAWARGVELIGANRAGLFINLVPVFGALLAVLLLGERFHGYHATGMALVLAGITLAERQASRPS